MISNIQLLRGLAALGVVIYHTAFLLNGSVHTDFMGVSIFFVISGFIMTYISRDHIDQFLMHRLVRIVPPYWIGTFFFVLWMNLGFVNPLYTFPLWSHALHAHAMGLIRWMIHGTGLENPEYFTKVVKSLFFIPYRDGEHVAQPVLAVGWTLNLEMFFYFVFALALKLDKKRAPFIACVVLVAVKFMYHFTGFQQLCFEEYSHPYTTFFILGVIVYYVWKSLDGDYIRKHRQPLVAGAILFSTAYVIWSLNPYFEYAILYYMPPFVVFLALVCHTAGARCSWKPILLLGDASYVLYLTHIVVLETLRTFGYRWAFFNFSKYPIGLLIALCMTISFAVAAHKYVELPLLRLAKRIFIRGRPRVDLGAEEPTRA